MSDNDVAALTTRVVTAYLHGHALPVADLAPLIGAVRSALLALDGAASAAVQPPSRQPAVPIRRSVSREAIVCLECDKAQRTLRRHLAGAHGLSTEEYRARWRLPADYPMTAPDVAAERSRLAKAAGFGKKGGRRRKA
ncbi:MucR family transcriptional regulator [Azospirillum sp.]|uniref:MucR family transcriptional regulator n=1 Tax=Azospirillum sp. TaxID=34012 RepID=UPI003D70A135